MSRIRNLWRQERALCIILVIFLAFFAVISVWSPVAGDDWAYAVNSVDHHPLLLALQRYYTWSGRILSELWGYIVPRNKWLWDWLNPLIFTGILLMLVRNADAGRSAGEGKSAALTALLAIAWMLSVTDYVRTQTYTWMMGTTYAVPLLLLLVELFLLDGMIFHGRDDRKTMALLGILEFTIPLWMENAAAIVVGGDLLILIYLFFRDRPRMKKMILLTALGAAGTLIIKMSPGAAGRLAMDHPDFLAMTLLQKIRVNWTSFLRMTYADNLWLTRGLSALMMVFVIARRRQYSHARWHCWVLALLFAWGLVQTFAYNLFELTGIQLLAEIADPAWAGFNKVNTVGYGLWTLAFLWVIFTYLRDERKWFTALVFFCAGGANLVMLLSPIFDARSSLYTIYLFILTGLLFLQELDLQKAARMSLAAVLIIAAGLRGSSYLRMYHEVSRITAARNAYVSWYLGDRSVKEGVMPAYPELYVHSGNIAEGDDFHLYYFLRYYDLDPSLKLSFETVDLSTVGK